MKSFLLTKRSTGEKIRVRFHNAGGYTIVDGNGEHEAGEWHKEQQYLDVAKGIISKGRNAVVYYAKPFGGKGKGYSSFRMKDLASCLAEDWLRKELYKYRL